MRKSYVIDYIVELHTQSLLKSEVEPIGSKSGSFGWAASLEAGVAGLPSGPGAVSFDGQIYSILFDQCKKVAQ